MGMAFAPTWLRQVSPHLLHKTTLTTARYMARPCVTCLRTRTFPVVSACGQPTGVSWSCHDTVQQDRTSIVLRCSSDGLKLVSRLSR